MKERFQIKDRFIDLLMKNPTREGFMSFIKESCGELDNIDFKEMWIDKAKLSKLMIALANSGGGLIVFGIKENNDNTFNPVGISELRDAAVVENDIAKFVPRNLKYTSLSFDYDGEFYGQYNGKKFQVIFVEDTPEYLPFFSLSSSSEIEKDCIYVRRGTASVKATASDYDNMIQRRFEHIFKESSDLSLREHMEQLQLLYDSIPRKKKVLVKRGNRFESLMGSMYLLSERITELVGEPDQYEEVPNENYPSEDYDQFIIKMIEKKKLKIEKVLDLK